jgi:hypothetical protein
MIGKLLRLAMLLQWPQRATSFRFIGMLGGHQVAIALGWPRFGYIPSYIRYVIYARFYASREEILAVSIGQLVVDHRRADPLSAMSLLRYGLRLP